MLILSHVALRLASIESNCMDIGTSDISMVATRFLSARRGTTGRRLQARQFVGWSTVIRH
jgi:hypothetical protein